MSFREDILAAIEDVRSLPGELDIRQFRVFVVVRAWDGGRPGVGNSITTETELLVSGYPPRVREVSSKDAIASGGLYTNTDLKVGPFTPSHALGGTDPDLLNPPAAGGAQTVSFRVEGPGLPGGSALFERVEDSTFGNFSHFMVLRQTGQQ